MFVVTQSLQITRTLQAKVLAALVIAVPAAILDITAKIALWTAGPQPGFDSVVSDFTLATYTGSTPQTIATVLGPLNFPGPNQGMHKEFDFLCTADPVADQIIQGILVTDTTGAILLAAERFVQTVLIHQAGDGLSYDFVLMPEAVWGGQNG